jgi:hypothetical protein
LPLEKRLAAQFHLAVPSLLLLSFETPPVLPAQPQALHLA